jgi:hypothetical protein
MFNKHPMPIGDKEIICAMMSLKVFKLIQQEKVQLTRSGKSIHDPKFIEEYERYVTLQYETLEEFFTQISRYLKTHGTPKTLAKHTLQEILSTLVCESCGEI